MRILIFLLDLILVLPLSLYLSETNKSLFINLNSTYAETITPTNNNRIAIHEHNDSLINTSYNRPVCFLEPLQPECILKDNYPNISELNMLFEKLKI